MRTTTPEAPSPGEAALSELLGSAVRARLLACLLLPGAEPAHIRDLQRRSGLPYAPLQRELKRFERLGLVSVRRVGRALVYAPAPESALLPGLRTLVRSAVGVVPLLAEALDRPDVEVAFVYGSVASGQDRPGSDVDILVVGTVDPGTLAALAAEAMAQTGREINEVTYEPQEFRQRVCSRNSFVTSVLEKPKVFLKGDEDDLRRLGEQRPDPAARPGY